MIIVTIYNKCETELNSTTGFNEDFKLFKIKYSNNLFNLTFKSTNEITKSYVDSLVQPDFECVSANFDDSNNRIILNFEKINVKQDVDAAQTVCIQTVKTEKTTPTVQSVEKVVVKTDANALEEVSKNESTDAKMYKRYTVRKPRARRRTKAEVEAERLENAKKLIGLA